MTAKCKHPIVKIVAREEDAEFVECQKCGEVFDSAEFSDIAIEEEDTLAETVHIGEPVSGGELTRWLRTARLMRMSLEVNGGICRSLLKIRHGVDIDDPEEGVVT